jgi:hypothetical protein
MHNTKARSGELTLSHCAVTPQEHPTDKKSKLISQSWQKK